MTDPIFSPDDRLDMWEAADSLRLASIGVEHMIEGIAPRNAPKPVSLDLDPMARLRAAGYQESAPLDDAA